MELQDLKFAISMGVVARVVLFQPRETESREWALYAYPEDGRANPFGSEKRGKEYLETARGEARTFASVDTALSVIRQCGWKTQVTIDL